MNLKKFGCGCLAAAALLMLHTQISLAVFADEEMGGEQDMSLTIQNQTGEESLEGVEFYLYQVANLHENDEFEVEQDFEDAGVSMSMDTSEESWFDRAVTLKSYPIHQAAENSPIEPVSIVETDQEGTAIFEDLQEGLFLLVGKPVAEDEILYAPAATLISLPYLDEDGDSLDYNPTISIKNSVRMRTDEIMDLSAVKVWKDAGYEQYRPSSITVTLYQNGEEYSTVELNQANNWNYIWRNLSSNAQWHLVERDIASGYTVTAVRNMGVITVKNTYHPISQTSHQPGQQAPNEPGQQTPNQPGQGASGTAAQAVLPQTGQLWWPVSLFSVCGLVLLLVGWKIRKKGSDCDEAK